jgi:hypothetical protein
VTFFLVGVWRNKWRKREEFIHQYPAISKLGECKEYTVKITAIIEKDCKCGSETGDEFKIESKVKICRPQNCNDYDKENSDDEEYMHGNNKHRIIARIGQETNAGPQGIINKSRIWSTCENEKWSNSKGDFVSSNAPTSVTTRLYGKVYKDNCKNELDNDKFGSGSKKAEATIKFSFDIATEKIDFWKKVKSNNISTGTSANIHALPIFP